MSKSQQTTCVMPLCSRCGRASSPNPAPALPAEKKEYRRSGSFVRLLFAVTLLFAKLPIRIAGNGRWEALGSTVGGTAALAAKKPAISGPVVPWWLLTMPVIIPSSCSVTRFIVCFKGHILSRLGHLGFENVAFVYKFVNKTC